MSQLSKDFTIGETETELKTKFSGSVISHELTGLPQTKLQSGNNLGLQNTSLQCRRILGGRNHAMAKPGHVGDQEQKHFSPLGTKLYFHVNSSRKYSFCFEPQHGRLVTWLQTKNIVVAAIFVSMTVEDWGE